MADNKSVIELNDQNFNETISKGVTLVDFYAEWCGPCRMIAPTIGNLATKLANTAKVGKIDVDTAQDTTQKYGVMSIPTLIVFKDGTEVKRFVGVKDEATLENTIKSFLS
ncbi:MAG: thioredoxin [Parachlamydiaceae bacterium]